MVDNIGNGRERLKDIVEKEAEEQQQDDYIDEQYDTVPKIKLVYEGTRVK